ncbi:MAG: hypothetical protein PHC30_08075 [Lentisphaeria bacterium]|nr:hypothetical protein [Lentisphaeria bacterium]
MSWKADCLLAAEFPPKHKMTMIRQNALGKWPVRRYFSRGFQKSSPPTQEGATIQKFVARVKDGLGFCRLLP